MACQFANVFTWSSSKLKNVERRVHRLFHMAQPRLSGLIGQEFCDVANFDLSMGKPVFFKNLYMFWNFFPCYNEGNTLLIDDSRYKCTFNRPGTYFVVLKERKKNWLIDELGAWLLKWNNAVDCRAFAECRLQPRPDGIDRYVDKRMKQKGDSMSYTAWQKIVGTQ